MDYNLVEYSCGTRQTPDFYQIQTRKEKPYKNHPVAHGSAELKKKTRGLNRSKIITRIYFIN